MTTRDSHREAIEAMATAIKTVPGFARIVWNAADNLHAVWSYLEDMRIFEATHTSKRGSYYQRLKASEATRADSFSAYVNAACIIVESISNNSDHDFIHWVVLTEIETLCRSLSWKECNRKALDY